MGEFGLAQSSAQNQKCREDLSLEESRLDWIANFIWGIADDVLRDL